MTRQVTGFLAMDGKFFAEEWEAELHDANAELIDKAESHHINSDLFVSAILTVFPYVERYINAKQEANRHSELTETNASQDEPRESHTGEWPLELDVRGFLKGNGRKTEEVLAAQITNYFEPPKIGETPEQYVSGSDDADDRTRPIAEGIVEKHFNYTEEAKPVEDGVRNESETAFDYEDDKRTKEDPLSV